MNTSHGAKELTFASLCLHVFGRAMGMGMFDREAPIENILLTASMDLASEVASSQFTKCLVILFFSVLAFANCRMWKPAF